MKIIRFLFEYLLFAKKISFQGETLVINVNIKFFSLVPTCEENFKNSATTQSAISKYSRDTNAITITTNFPAVWLRRSSGGSVEIPERNPSWKRARTGRQRRVRPRATIPRRVQARNNSNCYYLFNGESRGQFGGANALSSGEKGNRRRNEGRKEKRGGEVRGGCSTPNRALYSGASERALANDNFNARIHHRRGRRTASWKSRERGHCEQWNKFGEL